MGKRRKKRPVWLTIPIWVVAGALVAWGLWQAMELRRSLMAQAPNGIEPENSQAITVPTTDTGGSATSENVSATQPQRDEWLEAMTPAVMEDDSPTAGGWDAAMSPAELLERGKALLDDGRLVEGRGALNAALAAMGENEQAVRVREQLTTLNETVFLGSAILPDDPAARLVDVQPGDSFLKLGQKYAVPAAFLEMVNPGVNPRNLKPDMGVKIVQGPFHIRLVKGARRLDLLARDMYVKSFPAEVMEGDYLPRGTYRLSSGMKIQVGKKQWIGIEGISEGTQDVSLGWLYGEAGPRMGKGGDRVSGIKLADADLAELYNVLVETRSLLRVVP